MLVMVDPIQYAWVFIAGWLLVLFSSLAPPAVYSYARHSLGGGWTGLRTIPAMMLLGTGLSINNAMAVIRGLFVRGGEFVRTPKSGSTQLSGLASRYKPAKHRYLWFAEMLLGAYCMANWAIYIFAARHYAFSVFLMIYSAAFLTIGWLSRPEASWRKRKMVLVDDTSESIPAASTQPSFAPAGPSLRAS
jgi:hypothetical protein